jgi:hypothetical protein
MATEADVRRISMSLPGVEQPPGRFAFAVRNKGKLREFVWVWMERVNPRKPRVANHDVIAVRVANLEERDRLLTENSTAYFTEPHYVDFPAVLVRLKEMKVAPLRSLIAAGWRCQAPPDLAKRRR